MRNLLENPSFEGSGSGEWTRDTHTRVEYGEIFSPIHWTTWWEEGEFKQPECKVIPNQVPFLDPPRICDGQWAWQAFTMFGRQHAGLYQVVENLVPGKIYRLTAKAHAWSAHTGDLVVPGADCSAGVGCGPVYLTPSQVPPLNGDPLNDAIGNFSFCVGAGLETPDPFSDQVVWGGVAHVYNGYADLPALELVAPSSGIATIYLKAYSLWNFKTSDAYWDHIELTVLGEPPSPPPYKSTMLVLPQNATEEQLTEIFGLAYPERRTFGFSHDDAGTLNGTAMLYNIANDDQQEFLDWYARNYLGTKVEFVYTSDWEDDAPPPPVLTEQLISLHLQRRVQHDVEFVAAVKPSVLKTVLNMEFGHWVKAASPNTLVVYRQWVRDQGIYWSDTDPNRGARRYLETFLDSLERNADTIDFVESLNETVATDDIAGIQRTVEFDIAFCEELKKAMGNSVRPAILTAAVGNPQHGTQTRMLIPAARACVEHKGILAYHGYSYYPGFDHFGTDWRHHAGRGLESWDVEFRAAGVYPRYIFTECGACATAHAGWRHEDCMGGNLDEYIEYLLELKRKLNEWNTTHGNRCLGATLFTSGGGSLWSSFELRGEDLRRLTQALLA